MEAFTPRIPDHVAPERLVDWSFQSADLFSRDPSAAMDSLRGGPDIVFSATGRRGRSTWIVKKYEHIVEALKDTELFSSDRYSGFSSLIGEDWPMIPSDVDAPMHRHYRRLLDRVFSGGEMAKLEARISGRVDELIDEVLALPTFDFQKHVARPLPTTVFLSLMGLPVEHADLFLEWEHLLMHGIDLEDRARGVRSIKDYLVEKIAEREADPQDDILTYVVQAKIEDRPLELWEKIGICFVLYAAGLDTVASALGFTFKHLGENPEMQRQLRDQPDARAKAVEEMLRANSCVVIGRWVTRDVEFHGVEMKKGDFVSLPTIFADRDPEAFGCPGQIDLERQNSMRHIAFGTGPHNCLGSHLARRELRITLDKWFERCPEFRLSPKAAAQTYGGGVFGVESLPLEWVR